MGLAQFDLRMLRYYEEESYEEEHAEEEFDKEESNFIFFFIFLLYLLHLLFNPWSITFISNPLGPRKFLVSLINQNIMLNVLFSFLNRSFSVISEFSKLILLWLLILSSYKFCGSIYWMPIYNFHWYTSSSIYWPTNLGFEWRTVQKICC